MENADLRSNKAIGALLSVLRLELLSDSDADCIADFSFEEVTESIGFDPPELYLHTKPKITAIITAVISVIMGDADYNIRSITKI